MADEPHFLLITADQTTYARVQDQHGQWRILIVIEHDSEDMPWLAPNVRLSLSLSPSEARQMAALLREQADAADA